MNPVETTLEFMVRDAVSKAWVWDASFRLQGRIIKAYYQSDRGPVPFVFSGLKPGKAELKISAPGYVPVTIPVELKRGKNRVDEPIDLVGYEIPGLSRFIIFEKREGNDFLLEIRPVSREGNAVMNHPCLDLWIGVRITVQMKDGLPVSVPVERGSTRGDELYRGKIDWTFDPLPETIFRYSSRIYGSLIKPSGYPYWVIDYLIVVPDPRKVNPHEVQKIMEKAFALPPETIDKYLEPYSKLGVLTPYYFTSWNVRGSV
ncbi:MAG: carboxypeptidase-like regulatory domain-containing protein [Spirochaetota bacterium]